MRSPLDALKKSWNWLRWVVALGALAYLFYRNREGLEKLRDKSIQWQFFLGAVVLCGSSTLVTFLRWWLLVAGQNFPFKIRDAMRLGFIGLLFNYVGPGAVGGDLFKAVFLAKEQPARRAVAVATILLDRVLGLLALFLVGAVTMVPNLIRNGLPTDGNKRTIVASLLGGSVAGLIGLLLMMSPKFTRSKLVSWLTHLPVVGRMAGEVIHDVELYQSKPKVIINSMLLSILGHAGLIGGFYCGALAVVTWAPTLAQHFSFMPIAELFSVLIPVPGGIGALEGAIQVSYTEFADATIDANTAGQEGFLAAIVFRLVTVLIASIGGIYYLLARSEVQAAMHEAEHLGDSPAAPSS